MGILMPPLEFDSFDRCKAMRINNFSCLFTVASLFSLLAMGFSTSAYANRDWSGHDERRTCRSRSYECNPPTEKPSDQKASPIKFDEYDVHGSAMRRTYDTETGVVCYQWGTKPMSCAPARFDDLYTKHRIAEESQ